MHVRHIHWHKNRAAHLTFVMMLDASPGGNKSIITYARTATFKSRIPRKRNTHIRFHPELSKIESKNSEQDGKIKESTHCHHLYIYIFLLYITIIVSQTKIVGNDSHISNPRGISFMIPTFENIFNFIDIIP